MHSRLWPFVLDLYYFVHKHCPYYRSAPSCCCCFSQTNHCGLILSSVTCMSNLVCVLLWCSARTWPIDLNGAIWIFERSWYSGRRLCAEMFVGLHVDLGKFYQCFCLLEPSHGGVWVWVSVRVYAHVWYHLTCVRVLVHACVCACVDACTWVYVSVSMCPEAVERRLIRRDLQLKNLLTSLNCFRSLPNHSSSPLCGFLHATLYLE